MLKSQDVVIALKLIALGTMPWTQQQLATWLCMSASEVNAGLKRLTKSGLYHPGYNGLGADSTKIAPFINTVALQEFLLHGFKYVFPAEWGEVGRGILTSYAAPCFNRVMPANDVPPVWPYEEGPLRGQGLLPLYPSVPKSLTRYPDDTFYHLLACLDVLRSGRARERQQAENLLSKNLESYEAQFSQ